MVTVDSLYAQVLPEGQRRRRWRRRWRRRRMRRLSRDKGPQHRRRGVRSLVLRGADQDATKMLTHRRVAILEFAYHVVGPWASTDLLRELLGWLASLGYSCLAEQLWRARACAPRQGVHLPNIMVQPAPCRCTKYPCSARIAHTRRHTEFTRGKQAVAAVPGRRRVAVITQ